ncbi:MAG TPA: pantoate--beta-alanine ligase [Myxococcota bacterium]|nr:pantoate--beta-alanine ligase [Myxococcota bacterium]
MRGEAGKSAAATQAPRIVRTVAELQRLADGVRAAQRRIALVPTMGALHAGHLALVGAARTRADRVWLSIFVNPTQFGPNEDFSRYPRPFEQDVALCGAAGVDLVFAPSAEEMYPPGAQTAVEVTELAKPLCGASRAGHFRGVATVVTKLLAAAKPHLAVFGEKDFQQLALIRQLVRDLLLDVEIVGVETARERDGLALSSRNALLAPEVRQDALSLVRALDAAEAALAGGEDSADKLLRLVRCVFLQAKSAELDYAELRDPKTLEAAPLRLCAPTLLALAARFPATGGGLNARVRLIDNRVLHPKPGLEERP